MSRALNFTRLNAPAIIAPAPESAGGEGIPEAPQDGTLYGRKDGAWSAVPDPSGDIQALQGRMDTAEGEIDALQASDTAQGERLDALETSDTAQDGKIAALEAADTALGERLTTAEGEIDALEASDTQQDGRLDALEASDTEQDGRLDALETSDTEQDGKITALEAADTALGERLDALETSDTEQDGKITALEAADTALGERLTTAEGEIDALQAADTAQGERLDALEASDTAQDGQITDLSGRVDALEQGGGGLSDAPQDGRLYGRKDGAWSDALEAPPAETHSYNSRIGYTCIHAAGSQTPEWVPSVLFGVSAYDLRISGAEDFFKPFYDVLVACSLARFPILMGGTQSETMAYQTLYSVRRNGREISIEGYDFNYYPDIYKFTFRCSDASGTFTITQCDVERT